MGNEGETPEAELARLRQENEDLRHELAGAATCINLWMAEIDCIKDYLRENGHTNLVLEIEAGRHR